MAEKLYYEDVTEGMEIPALAKVATSRALVMYCAAYEDFSEIHHDKDAAQQAGWPSTVVPGLFTSAFLAQMLTDWITPDGTIKRLKANYRRPHFAGETIICKGKVDTKRIEDSEHLVECEIWAENAQGERSTLGSAVITIPSRGG
ncbi:hypothetical protein FIM08_00135 [SAR202 cluster bacterium AC-647-N09_OGT_505m]|nr:hypothetical protein [SAR202 cluster bacterium AC-647-N09_OGT_505m]